MNIEVAEDSISAPPEYASVPISFEVREVLAPDDLTADPSRRRLTIQAVKSPFIKDYDWVMTPDLTDWAFFVARSDGVRVGGAAVGFEGRNDLAVLWDIRVAPAARHCGVGTALLRTVQAWASRQSVSWLKVETQNINVPAYRFYLHHGFTLTDVRPGAYPQLPDEVQLLLHKRLAGPHGIPDVITTPRLVLRRWLKSDAAQLKAAIDDNLGHLQAWMPWAMAEPSPLEAVEERIAKFEAQFDSGLDWLFAIRSRSADAVLGGAGLHPRIGPDGLEIGYWLQAGALRNGFATEAADALTQLALRQPGVERVQIRCDPKNAASAGIPRRLDFQHILTIENETFAPAGSLRDTMVWERISPKGQRASRQRYRINIDTIGLP